MAIKRILFALIAFGILPFAVAETNPPRLPEGWIAYVEQRPIPNYKGFASAVGGTGQAQSSPPRGGRFQRTQEVETASPIPSRSAKMYESAKYDIFVMKPDGSEKRRLTADGMNHRPRWSPDGQWIAYENGPRELVRLYAVRWDGSETKLLLEREIAIAEYWWSPDSRKLLAAVESKQNAKLVEGRVVDIASGNVGRLTNNAWMEGWNHYYLHGIGAGQSEHGNLRRRRDRRKRGSIDPFRRQPSRRRLATRPRPREDSPDPSRCRIGEYN